MEELRYALGLQTPAVSQTLRCFPSLFRQNCLVTCYSRLAPYPRFFACMSVLWVWGWAEIRVACFWEKTVSAMRARIVMACFVLFKTHCKLYQSPNKSCWRENTTQDIWLFNDRELRWRHSGLDWGWMLCMGSAREGGGGGVIHWDTGRVPAYTGVDTRP